MNSKIEFYFDFLSPFSYLAWTKIRTLNWNLKFYPVSLPSVISSYETKGPGQIQPKRDYLTREILRYKTIHQIPFVFPPQLPFNSLYALRLCLIENNPKALVDIFFRAAWEKGLDIGDDEVVKNILNENGFDALEMLEKISGKEIKLKLRANNEQAIQKGVFGVPTFIVVDNNHEELFWGNDSIANLQKYLEGKDPLPIKEYQEFLKKFPM